MAIQTADVLKGYFNAGDTPTESQLADLVDTLFGMAIIVEPTGGNIIAGIGAGIHFVNPLIGNNVLIGQNVGAGMTTCADSVGIGGAALQHQVGGGDMVAVGINALMTCIDGFGDNAYGDNSMIYLEHGTNNNAFGFQSFAGLTSANGNSGFGDSAGRSVLTGSYNSFLGMHAGYHASQKTDAAYSTAIGYGAYTTKDYQVVLGADDVVETLLRGDVAHTGSKIGFNGTAPIAKPLLATGAGRVVDDVITVLQNYGLVRQS